MSIKCITVYGQKGKRGKRRPVWTGAPEMEMVACWRYGWGIINSELSGITWSVDVTFQDGTVKSVSLKDYYKMTGKYYEEEQA